MREKTHPISLMKAAVLSLILACATALCVAMPNQAWAVEKTVGNASDLIELFDVDGNDDAAAGDTIIIQGEINIGSSTLYVNESVTIKGADSSAKILSSAEKIIRVNDTAKGAANATVVTFQDVTIEGTAAKARCIDTRSGNIKVVLDNTTLNTTSADNNQPITIGGTGNTGIVLEIKNNSEINAGIAGYGIIAFNPVTISIENSAINAYGTLYMKSGSDNSEITIKNSELYSNNPHPAAGGWNKFAAITLESANVKINVIDSSIKAETAGQSQQNAIASTIGGSGTLTVTGNSELNAPASDMMAAGDVTVSLGAGVSSNVEIPEEFLADGLTYEEVNGEYVVVEEQPATNPGEGSEGTVAPSAPEDSKESEKTSTPKTGDAAPFAAVAGIAALAMAGAVVARRQMM